MKFALSVEYDGSQYCGWQRQSHSPSVQQTLEEALSRVANEPISVMCAGRTDTGVHGLGQVVHFETNAIRPEKAWVMGGNVNLPRNIAIHWAVPVAEDFHARYSAVARSYRYLLLNRPVRPAVFSDRVAWERSPLDVEAMHHAAQALIGEHDFSAFRAAGCQAKHARRNLQHISVTRHGALVQIDLTANAFLYNMVRIIVGTLLRVGKGEKPIDWVAQVLASQQRTHEGITAPPGGLYFLTPVYPEHFQLPKPASSEFPMQIGL